VSDLSGAEKNQDALQEEGNIRILLAEARPGEEDAQVLYRQITGTGSREIRSRSGGSNGLEGGRFIVRIGSPSS